MSEPFLSYAQNGEDVVLWRALGHVRNGFYLDVGANDPAHFSVTRAFYDAGWSGLTVEPLEVYAEAHRRERPRDTLVQAVAGRTRGESVTLHAIDGSGLSTVRDDIAADHRGLGFELRDLTVPSTTLDDMLAAHDLDERDIHFAVIDVEGAEADALAGLDLAGRRPWVLVIESVAPLTDRQEEEGWEPAVLSAGYVHCLFDGLSRFYVRADLADTIGPALSIPAGAPGVTDRYTRVDDARRAAALDRARADAIRWRGLALDGWAATPAVPVAEVEALVASERARADAIQLQLDLFKQTLSWRVTRPLRWVRGERSRAGRQG